MAALVIKKLPDPIHKALKARAKINHRSMTSEVIAALENIYLFGQNPQGPFMVSESQPGLGYQYEPQRKLKKIKHPKPVKLKGPESSRWIEWAMHGESEHPEPIKLRFKVTDESFNKAKRKGLE